MFIHTYTYIYVCILVQAFWAYTVHDKLDSFQVKEISLSALLCIHQEEQQ
jgi:hypothetical protein